MPQIHEARAVRCWSGFKARGHSEVIVALACNIGSNRPRPERRLALIQPRAPGSYDRHLNGLWRDVRFGLRVLAKNKSFAAVAVLAPVLGFGPNTALFSVIYATLPAPMAYTHPDQLVVVFGPVAPERNVRRTTFHAMEMAVMERALPPSSKTTMKMSHAGRRAYSQSRSRECRP